MFEAFSTFHFGEPAWLWALLIPFLVALWIARTSRVADKGRIRSYAEPHLLQHLLGRRDLSPRGRWRYFGWWLALWVLAVLALAGPRWSYTDVQLFRPGSNLVVVVDISKSMDVQDVKPSRLARARQELEDIVDNNKGIRIGLIAFASVAHVAAPITEDMEGIRRLLPVLSTDLVTLQGSRLSFALDRARNLLDGQPEDSANSVLLISDGDFDEPGIADKVRELASSGIEFHILGVGTPQGEAVKGPDGRPLMGPDRRPVVSRLNEPLLRGLAVAGNGIYQRADFRSDDSAAILKRVSKRGPAKADQESATRVWNERFYLLTALAMLLLLPQFRGLRAAVVVKRG